MCAMEAELGTSCVSVGRSCGRYVLHGAELGEGRYRCVPWRLATKCHQTDTTHTHAHTHTHTHTHTAAKQIAPLEVKHCDLSCATYLGIFLQLLAAGSGAEHS